VKTDRPRSTPWSEERALFEILVDKKKTLGTIGLEKRKQRRKSLGRRGKLIQGKEGCEDGPWVEERSPVSWGEGSAEGSGVVRELISYSGKIKEKVRAGVLRGKKHVRSR